MKLIIPVLLFFIFSQSNGQNIQIKIDDVNFDFLKNSITKNACYSNSVEFQPFYNADGNYSLCLPSIKDMFNYKEKGNESTIFQLEWDHTPVIITITEYPKIKFTFKELIFKRILSISPYIGKKYDFGIEKINSKDVYWFKELVPDLEFGAYSTLFYIYNEKKDKIYLLDFSTFKESNCKLKGLMIDVLKSIVWESD